MTSHAPYRTIVFDLDGTLLDTWPSLLAAVRYVADSHVTLNTDAMRQSLSAGIPSMFASAARLVACDAATRATVIERMSQRYVNHELLNAVPYRGTDRLLRSLLASGYTLALCTNRDRRSTLALLSEAGWQDVFDAIHCLDDGYPAKPHPAGVLALLGRLACTPDAALFVGDSAVDANCAVAAHIDFAAHMGGYHASIDELIPAVLTFDDPRTLSEWLTQHATHLSESSHV